MASISVHLWDHKFPTVPCIQDLQEWVVLARQLMHQDHELRAIPSTCQFAHQIPDIKAQFLSGCDLNIVLLHTATKVRPIFRDYLAKSDVPFALFHYSREDVPRFHVCVNPYSTLILEDVVDDRWMLAIGKREWWQERLVRIEKSMNWGRANV